MPVNEKELLRAAQHGDHLAFGTLIRPYMDPMFGLAARIVENRTEAEDAVQDALYKAWRALPHFRGDAKFSTWLYRIVWRVCVDRTRQKRTLPLDNDYIDRSTAHNPEKQWDHLEEKDQLSAALQQLSLPYRTVLFLFYVEDLSLKDVADIVQSPIGTVKTRLHRARKALRKILLENQKGRRGR